DPNDLPKNIENMRFDYVIGKLRLDPGVFTKCVKVSPAFPKMGDTVRIYSPWYALTQALPSSLIENVSATLAASSGVAFGYADFPEMTAKVFGAPKPVPV